MHSWKSFMPALENNENNDPIEIPGQSLAILAEALYLMNLLLAPGLAFLALFWLYFTRGGVGAPLLADCHLRQTISASIWAGVGLVVINALIILFGGCISPTTWVIVILYFTIGHSSLGVFGLAKALAGQIYVYPLVGRLCDD